MSEYILHGDPMPENITEGSNSLGEFLIKKLKSHGDQVLLTHCITGENVSASQLLQKSVQVAKSLRKYGIKAGDSVGIICENEFEFIFIEFGSILLGAFVAPLNPTHLEEEINHFYNFSKPRIVFTSMETLDKVLNVARMNANIGNVIAFGDNVQCQSFRDFIIQNDDIDDDNEDFDCVPQNIRTTTAVVLTSSGTTGLPKCVEIPQQTIFEFVTINNTPKIHGKYSISVVPFYYIGGFISSLNWLSNGFKSVVMPKYDKDIFLDCIQKYQIKHVYLPLGPMYMLATSPSIANYDLSSLEYIITGSSVVSEWIVDQIYKRIDVKLIIRIYGCTESIDTHAQSVNRPLIRDSKSIGMLRPGVSAKICDPDTGKILGPNQTGEIMCKNSRQMKRYINSPEITAQAFDKDGFYHSGDLGYYDENGEWFFVERIKDLIKYNNFNISPCELEQIIALHPHVRDACVIGVPHQECMEYPMAFVVTDGDGTVSAKEIVDFVAERVSPPKYLRGGVKFISKIPRNANGKALRRVLREQIHNKL